MKFYKFISVILHPIVIPTLGVLIYFILIPNRINSYQKFLVLGLIFVITYLIPLFVLIILKKFGFIKSYQVATIKERKIPLSIMILIFYFLGNTFFKIPFLRDLGILFFATSFGLVIVYVFFIFKLKTSLHLLSIGIASGFFLLLSALYTISFLPIILTLILVSGILASSRLYLKAHSPKEVYFGFFLGFLCPFMVNLML